MKKKLLTLIIALFATITTPALGQSEDTTPTAESMRKKLESLKTPSDSLEVYYDILDLSERKKYKDLIREMYGVAKRAGNVSAQLDLCRQITAVLRDDPHFAEIEEEVSKLPASDEQKETDLFIKMKRISYMSSHIPEAERQKEVTKLLANIKDESTTDKYDKVYELFSVVEFLRHVATEDMLDKYMSMLFKLINDQHFKIFAIPNIVYAESANIYSDAGNRDKAIKADKHLLNVIDGLEKKYRGNGRIYRNYDVSRYVCYRRMLRNYEALENCEAEELFAKIKTLAAVNPDVKEDLETNPRTLGFYYMAVGDYNAAIPYLKETLDNAHALSIRRQVLEALLKATEQTGDKETRLYVLTQYKYLYDEYIRLKSAQQYNELQIKYNLKSLEQQNEALLLENRNEEIESARKMMTILLVAFLVLAGALIISVYEWTRSKKNLQKMRSIAERLRTERNKLVENYFDYNEVSTLLNHQRELNKFHERKQTDAAGFITECINNLLNIALMGGNERLKHILGCSVTGVMREAAAKASLIFDNPTNMAVEYLEEDFRIVTDRQCLIDSIVNLIESMAMLGGTKNKVELSVQRTSNGHTNFIMTNQVNISYLRDEHEIFKNMHFTEDMMAKGKNGLYICRMIALKLSCTLILDKTYTKGARYILSVPDDITSLHPHKACRTKTEEHQK